MIKPKRWVILADLHSPEVHEPSFKAVLNFIKANDVDGVVLLGDNLNCENVSRHTKGKPGLRKRGGYQRDLDTFSRRVLDRIEPLLKPNCEKIFFIGNHEAWIDQMIEEMPELEDAVSIAKNLRLAERGWKVVPQGQSYRVGKAYLIHGDQVGSSIHVAKKAVDSFSATVVMGHCHTAQMFTKTSQVKSKSKWAGYVIPTLGTVAPKYAKGRPNSHVNGFGIIEEWEGMVNVYIVIITHGCFSYGGKMYAR